jgi:hypothetical protein
MESANSYLPPSGGVTPAIARPSFNLFYGARPVRHVDSIRVLRGTGLTV